MKTSPQGLDLLIEREIVASLGIPTRAYRDTKGYMTIGIGHLAPELREGEEWTVEKCKAVFAEDIKWAEDAVNGCVQVPLEQYQFDALVSFTFNAGKNALPYGDHGGPCSILRALNRGDYDGAGAAFNNWMADPEVRTRRAGEREQFKGEAFVARVERAA